MRLARVIALADQGLSFDLETWMFTPELPFPPIVCGSVAWLMPGPKLQSALLDKQDALEMFCKVLEDDSAVLIGANIGGFDLGVCAASAARRDIDIMPWIFRMLEQGRVFDVLLAETLNAIANGTVDKDPRTMTPLRDPITKKPGRYSLSIVTDLVLGRTDAKAASAWRLRYKELDGIPLDQWPQEARDYPQDDVINAGEVGLAQAGILPQNSPRHNWATVTNPDGSVTDRCADCGSTRMNVACQTRRRHRNLVDLSNQVGTAFALALGAAHGFIVDQSSVDVLEAHTIKKRDAGIGPFIEAGIIRPDGTEDRSVIKRMVALAYGAWEQCPHCAGTGKRPSPAAKPVRCPACKGYCLAAAKTGPKCNEWRAMAGPEGCLTCSNTGLVPNPNPPMIVCGGTDEEGAAEKTCDGSGLVLIDSVPRSDKGGIAYGRDCLVESGDEKVLMLYGSFLEDAKLLKDYVPYLRTARMPIDGHLPECKWKDGEACACPGDKKDVALTLRPNTIVVSGRGSYSGYIQLFSRKPGYIDKPTGQYIPSTRECLIARPGKVLSSEDFAAGELVTHAQSCLWLVGRSDLATALLNDIDVHSALAATILGMDYKEFFPLRKKGKWKNARQGAKPENFGNPGLMSAPTLVLQQRKQGDDTVCPGGPSMVDDGTGTGTLVEGFKGLRFCILMQGATYCGTHKTTEIRKRNYVRKVPPTCTACLECAESLRLTWMRQWSESQDYFDYVKMCVEAGMIITHESLERWPWLQEYYTAGEQLAPGEVMQHYSGRIRGGLEAPACANTFFQGLLADAAKAALRQAQRECFDKTLRVTDMMFENSLRSQFAGLESPLYGSRIIVMQHDELIAEHDEAIAPEAAERISEIMRDQLRKYCPDLAYAAKAEPTLMKRWDKRAAMVREGGRPDGRLQVWEPGQ